MHNARTSYKWSVNFVAVFGANFVDAVPLKRFVVPTQKIGFSLFLVVTGLSTSPDGGQRSRIGESLIC